MSLGDRELYQAVGLKMEPCQLLAGSEEWVRVLGRKGGCRALIGLGEAGRGGADFER